MARFRALEAGRFLMRATSNGITAVIGPDGEVVSRIPQFKPGILSKQQVPTVDELLQLAIERGVKLYPCGFTIDTFGYAESDFVPGVQPRTGLTPYARTGNWPILSLAFLLLIGFAIHRVRTRHYA